MLVFWLFYSGNLAVCIFFVMSGYVLTAKFWRTGNMLVIADLAARRYIRLTPPILLSLLIGYALVRSGLILVHEPGAPVWSTSTYGTQPSFLRTLEGRHAHCHRLPGGIRQTMATEKRANNVPEAEINGFIGHRAYGGKTEVYAKYRPDYLIQVVAVIEGYVDVLRASCVLDRGYLPERKAIKKEP